MLDFKSVTTFLFHIVSLDTFEILLDLDALNQPFRARWATLLLHGVRPPFFSRLVQAFPLLKVSTLAGTFGNMEMAKEFLKDRWMAVAGGYFSFPMFPLILFL